MSCEIALQNPPPIQAEFTTSVLVVAAALIDTEGRVLCTQRPAGKWMAGLWEFPGGKVEKGELPEFSLMRELREELGIETRPSCMTPLSFISHFYEDTKTHILMPLYVLRFWDGTPQAREGQSMAWLKPQEMYGYDFVEADRPLFSILEDYLN